MKTEPQVTIQYISPEVAKGYLANNRSNRPLSPMNVDRYARDILEGQWKVTHQGILIGKNGALIDGQHRLNAIIKANTGIKMQVTYDDSISSPLEVPIDTGKKRTVNISLGVSTTLAAAASFGLKICSPNRSHTLHEMQSFIEKIRHENEMLGHNKRKGITTPIRLAAIAQIKSGADIEFVIKTYGYLVGDYKKLDPCPASLFNQIIIERITFSQHELLARALKIFDVKNREKSKLQIKNVEDAISEATLFIKKTFL